MITGAVVVFVWGNITPLHDAMYEIVPGFLLNLLVAVVVSRMTYKHNETIEAEFSAMEKEVSENAPYVAETV